MSEFITFLKNNKFLFDLIFAALEIGIGFIIGPFLRNLIIKMRPKGVEQGVLTFTGSFVNIFVRVLAVVIALAQIGVNMDVVVGAFSAVGLGVSLALKENMSNVACGLQILITRPFAIGDYIAMDGNEGTVTQIELMFTTLETVNGQEVVIPNSSLVSNTIVNYSEFPKRRIAINVPVNAMGSYQTFRSEMVEAMKNMPKVYQDPAPSTAITGFTESGNGMILRLTCYCNNKDYWDLLYELNDIVQQKRTALNLLQPIDIIQVKQS